MREDELMDGLLREALNAESPRLSRDFDSIVMKRVRARRLTAPGRVAMAIYFVVSVAAAGSLMRHVPLELIGVSSVVLGALTAGISLYVRQLTRAAS